MRGAKNRMPCIGSTRRSLGVLRAGVPVAHPSSHPVRAIFLYRNFDCQFFEKLTLELDGSRLFITMAFLAMRDPIKFESMMSFILGTMKHVAGDEQQLFVSPSLETFVGA